MQSNVGGDYVFDVYTVSFFGHREVYDFFTIEKHIEKIVYELISDKKYVEFLVGRNGGFDQLVSSVIHKVKRTYGGDNCAHILVLPYATAEFRDNEDSFNEYYDRVEIFEKSDNTHFKAAFQSRNRQMIDQSNLVVFYLEREYGGAYQTYKYASKINKEIIKIP